MHLKDLEIPQTKLLKNFFKKIMVTSTPLFSVTLDYGNSVDAPYIDHMFKVYLCALEHVTNLPQCCFPGDNITESYIGSLSTFS